MSGSGGIERQAKREFERAVLEQIVALCAGADSVSTELVEQAIGYYRHAESGNPVQQVLGRRFRTAITSLRARRVLAPDTPPDRFALTPHGRAVFATTHWPWWRRGFLQPRAGQLGSPSRPRPAGGGTAKLPSERSAPDG
jgi:hypothetical protein